MNKLRIALLASAVLATSSSLALANDFEKFLNGVVTITVKPITIVPELLSDIARGKNLGTSAQKHLHKYLEAHRYVARPIAAEHSKFSRSIRGEIRKRFGDVAGDVADLSLEQNERKVQHLDAAVDISVNLAKGEGLVSVPAGLLAAELRLAESIALPESRSLPSHVVKKMEGLFPQTLLGKARYVVGHKASSNVADILNGSLKISGITNAVTVGRVMIFANEPAENYNWWAHELGHVQQYQEMGFDGFARAYVKNRNAIENDADRRAKIN